MTPQEMYVLAASLGEAKSRQNVEDALQFLHADMVLHSSAWGVVARGTDENRQLLSHFFDSYPDYSVSFEGYVADAETLFGWGIVRMTMAAHARDARGMSPNGQRITLPVTIRMTFKDGLIATEHFSCDLAQIAAQSGISIDGMWKNVFGASPVSAAARRREVEMLDELKYNAADWDANSPPGLEFLFEARVKLHLPAMDVGPAPCGNRVIFLVKGGEFEGPHLRGRVVPDSGADWIRIRPDGTGVLDVRFCLETHDNALLYLHWQGRFWSAPDDAEYALDLEKPDDPAGAWRYYFRAAPQFETGDSRYAWLNNIIAVTKSRTGDGGPIHRVFAVK